RSLPKSTFKKIYKPTNNNLRTSSNTSRANQDNSPRIHRNAGYESQRSGNVAGARETVEAEKGKRCSLSQGKDAIVKNDLDSFCFSIQLISYHLFSILKQSPFPECLPSATIGVGSSSAPMIAQVVPTTLNLKVWQHYNLCKMTDGSTKAQCKHCFHFLVTGSNSTLRNHFMIPYCEALKTVPEAGQSSMARDESLFVYNPDVVRE
nr:hypothetical protein [Tanacetum cinerariifolium]